MSSPFSTSTSNASSQYIARGSVLRVQGPLVEVRLPAGAIGDQCRIQSRSGALSGRIVSFMGDRFFIAPFAQLEGIAPGDTVTNSGTHPHIKVSEELLGKTVDGLGIPYDGVPIKGESISLSAAAPNPLFRTPIRERFCTGVRAIDAFCPLGRGQRIGMLAPAGTGKSTLLGMIASHSEADINVIALVGERGREVGEFINELSENVRRKSIIVVSTSDEPPIRRQVAPLTATAIAEYFRDQGKNVLLLVDSLTRTARAIRDLSLSAGEIPIRQGFTPSVYSELPRLLERAGTNSTGSITALYTLLTHASIDADPLSEEVKSLLDGHIVLSEELARRRTFPAIEIIESLSRLSTKLLKESELRTRAKIVRLSARLKKDRDVLLLGGIPDAELTEALGLEAPLRSFVEQAPLEHSTLEETESALFQLCSIT